MKKHPCWWCFFRFILQGKLSICLKNFKSFAIVQTHRNKIVCRKEVENDSNTKFHKNLVMELNNAKPNGCNVVVDNLHPMVLLFSKILKNELNKGLQSLYYSRKSITAYKLKLLITFISLIKAFHVNINLKKKLTFHLHGIVKSIYTIF